MAFPTYQYQGYQPSPYYSGPVPDQLSQLRQNQQFQTMQQPLPVQAQPQQPDSGIIWVQGEAGAKAYLVAPGNTVPLWDSENQTIYLKSADMSGMPSMRVLDYTERMAHKSPQQVQQNPGAEYVTRTEFDALASRLDAITANTKKEDIENG